MIHDSRGAGRRGVTLLEVLTAIFIMGVGLLAILTLFPLGALSMARAVRDDRAATIAANAASLAIALDLRNDPDVAAMLAVQPVGPWPPPAPEGPGYPVYVDPAYRLFGPVVVPAQGQPILGAGNGSIVTPGIRRVAPQYVSAPLGSRYGSNANTPIPAVPRPLEAMPRWFTFQDEIGFDKNGTPAGTAGGTTTGGLRRPGTYTCAYMLRRLLPSSPQMTDMAVVVYANRTTDSVQGETTVWATGAAAAVAPFGFQGTTSLRMLYSPGAAGNVNPPYNGVDRPNLRKGSWILDTSRRPVASVTMPGVFATVNADFYRVASVTDITVGGLQGVDLEVETPLKWDVTTLVIMENVITVLQRNTGTQP